MKYVKSWKIFENNHDLYNKEDIEDIFIDFTDVHNLKIKDISTGNSIEMPSDVVDGGRDFIIKDDNTYKSLGIRLERTGILEYTNEFYEDLKLAIERSEKVFNLKLKCIFFRATVTMRWWFKTLDLFKYTVTNVLSSGDLTTEREKEALKKPLLIELMFERL